MSWPFEPPPEIPYPFRPTPEQPRRADPFIVPTVSEPASDAATRLFDRRMVLLNGPLDGSAATRVCVELMALDGSSGRGVEVVINSPGGPLTEVASVLDVIALMRALVHTTCVGAARGTAAIVLACGTGIRRAAPSAMISLRCDRPESLSGITTDIVRQADELQLIKVRLGEALVNATGTDGIADEIDMGGIHDATEAQTLGLIDEIATAEGSDT